MSDFDAIQLVLARAASRRRWERAWNGLWQGLFVGTVALLAALATYKLAPVPFTIINGAGIFAGLCILGGFAGGWMRESPSFGALIRNGRRAEGTCSLLAL